MGGLRNRAFYGGLGALGLGSIEALPRLKSGVDRAFV